MPNSPEVSDNASRLRLVPEAFAGHSKAGNGEVGSTAVYVRADLGEVAGAVAALTGEPHPVAHAHG
ncbi:hypothetical protein GCM10009681_09540 [Luedemannella helvata]|uniref:Uncharacterized protein n=1 Tax=Luedemannella helvata TaxID=349315 RepID=A0ABP4VXB7_9ACTN